jgi:hypothetical protein
MFGTMTRVIIIIILISLVLIISCNDSTISEAEAIAIVKQARTGTINRNGDIPWYVGGNINDWDADYKGKGHWRVTLDTPEGIYSWDYFESSGKIQYRGYENK